MNEENITRINLLSEQTSNKIAAGEVVERPSSVVKELLENSIDAKSKNIHISIEEGGENLILVKDDGIGIHYEDVKLAFMPHATSKINELDDIYNITSLGFRGEALPSIASISKVNLKSRLKDSIEGTEIELEGGNIVSFGNTGCSQGTTIEVSNLFYNVPARQKFLKSSKREAAIISDLVLRMALAHNNISFKYFNNGKQVYSTSGSGDLLECIRVLYGKEVCNNIYNFEGHSDIATVYGYIGNEQISKGSRNRQNIYVNKRLIKSKLITTAVENAFRSFLTVNKYPFFTLFLEIYPELIDVNVHPTKSEIKFKDDRFIFKFVFDSVHHALRESLKDTFSIDISEEQDLSFKNQNEGLQQNINKPFIEQNSILESIDKGEFTNNIRGIHKENFLIKENFDPISKDEYRNNNEVVVSNIEKKYECEDHKHIQINEECNNRNNTLPMGAIEIKEAKFPTLRIIGQFDNTYILAEAFHELYIVDQHAAHEKIMFEKYMKEIGEKQVISQMLLVPMVCELTPEDFAIYEENKEVFTGAGFNIEYFGENTISIREVPIFLGKLDTKHLFFDILEDLKRMGIGDKLMVRYNKIATIACKSAVKAKNSLSVEEMTYLLEELRFIEEPFTCPHGRPTILKYNLKDIEKKFKRIQ